MLAIAAVLSGGALIAGATLTAQIQPSMWVVAMVCPSVLLATIYYRYWLKSINHGST